MNYAATAAKVAASIKKSGQPITLLRTFGGVYNPGTGITTAQTIQEYPGFGLETAFKSSDIDGTNIQVGDVSMMLVGLPDLLTGDSIKYNLSGKISSVVSFTALSPAGIVLYQEATLR